MKDNPKFTEGLKTSSAKAEKYVQSKLENDSTSKEGLTNDVLNVWDNVKEVIGDIVQGIDRPTALEALENIETGLTPYLDYVCCKIGGRGEQELCSFLDTLIDLRKESQFWLSLDRIEKVARS